MAAGICVCCQRRSSKVELQHVAGRVNHPFKVPVCKKSHQLLTFRQGARGVPLSHDLPADPTRELMTVIDGAVDLLAVGAERRPEDVPIPSTIWRCALRVLHHVLFPADGFQPDPRVTTFTAFARSGTPRPSDQLQVVARLAPMLQLLAHLVPGTPQIWRELADRAVTLKPAVLDEVVTAALDADWFGQFVTDLNAINSELITLALAGGRNDPRLPERLQQWALIEHRGEEMAQRILDAIDNAA